MPSIAVVTDTDSSLPVELARRYKIVQVPISIHFGGENFLAVEQIDDAATFARIDQENQLPTTSAPGPGQFQAAFERAFSSGAEQILCFCVSSQVSATYNAAVVASGEFPGRDIRVLDTGSLSMGQGFMALAAAETAAAGASLDDCLQSAESTRQRTYLYAALSTVKYLAMSGRVGHLAAGLASLLDMRPILTLRDGKLDLLERTRTRHKAWSRVIDLACSALKDRPVERMAILHVDALEDARKFLELLSLQMPVPEDVLFAELTPGLSVHAGAGLVGVTIVAGKS